MRQESWSRFERGQAQGQVIKMEKLGHRMLGPVKPPGRD